MQPRTRTLPPFACEVMSYESFVHFESDTPGFMPLCHTVAHTCEAASYTSMRFVIHGA